MFQNSPQEENWYITTTGTYLSAQETKFLLEPGDTRLAGLPFDQSTYTFADHQGATLGQLALVNLSTAYPYDFTSLSIYKNLDLAFFNTSGFDSAAAIASGELAVDAIAQLGTARVPVNGLQSLPEPDQTFPFLEFPLGAVVPNRYVLVTGTARPILSDNNFGPETPFAFAIESVPEPPTLILLSSVMIAFFAYFWQLSSSRNTTQRCKLIRRLQ